MRWRGVICVALPAESGAADVIMGMVGFGAMCEAENKVGEMALLVASKHGRVAAMCTLLVRPDQICRNFLQAF